MLYKRYNRSNTHVRILWLVIPLSTLTNGTDFSSVRHWCRCATQGAEDIFFRERLSILCERHSTWRLRALQVHKADIVIIRKDRLWPGATRRLGLRGPNRLT